MGRTFVPDLVAPPSLSDNRIVLYAHVLRDDHDTVADVEALAFPFLHVVPVGDNAPPADAHVFVHDSSFDVGLLVYPRPHGSIHTPSQTLIMPGEIVRPHDNGVLDGRVVPDEGANPDN